MSCVNMLGGYAGYPGGPPLKRSEPPWTRAKARRLDGMARDPNPQVRAVAANHPKIPDATLRALLRDEDVSVRRAAAKNPSIDRAMLRIALKDEDPGIAAYCKMVLDLEEDND